MNVERVTDQVKKIYGLTIDLSAVLQAMAELEAPSNLIPPALFFVRELEERIDLLADEFGGWAKIGVLSPPRPAKL